MVCTEKSGGCARGSSASCPQNKTDMPMKRRASSRANGNAKKPKSAPVDAFPKGELSFAELNALKVRAHCTVAFLCFISLRVCIWTTSRLPPLPPGCNSFCP